MKKFAAFFVVMALIGSYFFFRRGTSPIFTVETVPIVRGEIVKTVSATGRAEAVNTVNVGTQVTGTIKAIYVDFNSSVKKGQLIAEIDPSLLQANVESAEADVLAAQANVLKAETSVKDTKKSRDRKKELFSRNLIAESELDEAQTEYDTAIAQLKAAQANVEQTKASLKHKKISLGYAKIASPINGVVIDRAVEVGQTVNATQSAPTLFTIAEDLTQMKVEADIDEADIGLIQAGQGVQFTVDAYADVTFHGFVEEIRLAPNTEGNIVTYTVIIKVQNPELKLMPGMTANVIIETIKKSGVLKISNAALRFKPNSELGVFNGEVHNTSAPSSPHSYTKNLWLYDGKAFQPVPITIGISDGMDTEISGEVKEGMKIVTGVVFGKETTTGRGSPFVPGPRR